MASLASEQAAGRPRAAAGGSLSRYLPWTSVRGLIAVGLTLLIIILAVVTIAASWQARHHQSELDDLEFHSTRALLMQNVATEASVAGLLLQRYVAAGGDDYVDEINGHAAAAQTSLQQVLIMGAPPGFQQVASTGVHLLQEAARAAQLRLIGDMAAAEEVLESIVPLFREYRLTLQELSDQELATVAGLRESADSTGRLTLWLLVTSGTIGVILGLAVSFQIARSIFTPLGALETAARRASAGDLSARAEVTAPRELAHLGSVMNEMMDGVEQRTADLKRMNEMLRRNNEELVKARSEAATDPLTDLGNHRSFHRRLHEEVAAADLSETSIGLVIVDLDGFKLVNDSLGHRAGDELLRDVAAALREHADASYTYRYGGDEFAVLLPGADHPATLDAAEIIRTAIQRIRCPNGLQVSASLGVACLPQSAATPEELVYRADAAMYWAKSTGKNRVAEWNASLASNFSSPGRLGGPRNHLTNVIADLISALASKDPSARDHSERCTAYTTELARELGLGEAAIDVLRLASLLHEVGMLSVPDDILNKQGPLDGHERERMERHPVDGADMLSHADTASPAINVIRHHHEHFDGTGHPDGLAGDEIPMGARIMLVIDAFDAMTHDRPYRRAMALEDAVAALRRCAGTQFDPDVVDAFLRVLDRIGDPHLRHAAHPPAGR